MRKILWTDVMKNIPIWMSSNITWLACMWQDWYNNYEASKHGKCAKSLLGADQNTTTPVQHVSCCKDFHRSPLRIVPLNTTPKKICFKGGSTKVQTAPVTSKIHSVILASENQGQTKMFKKNQHHMYNTPAPWRVSCTRYYRLCNFQIWHTD